MNKIFYVIPLILGFISAHAEKAQLISFDFEKLSVSSEGIYVPNSPGKHSMDVIKAEVAARANGIDNITKYLNQSCTDVNQSALGLQPKLETVFKSQGTEIFSNGTLKVNLTASYKNVFRYKESAKLLTENGQSIVFALPSAIPVHALKCGSPILEFTNNLNQTMHVQIIPAQSKKTIDSNEKIIRLVYNEQKRVLIAATQNDSILLRTANFTFDNNDKTFLPVAVYSKSATQN